MNKIIKISLAFALLACGKKQEKTSATLQDDEVIVVKTEAVSKANNENTLSASGVIGSLQEARLSFKTGGVIERIFVKEGDKVNKGQLLATLNLTEINAQVTQATEAVNKAQRDLNRITNLYNDSITTLEQVQNLTTQLSVSKQNLQIAQYNRSYSQIHAPNAGTVIKKMMNEGELAGPGNPVVYIIGTSASDWVLRTGVPDKDWVRLRKGNKALVSFDAFPDKKFTAIVHNLAQAPDQTSGMYQIELKLNTSGNTMATGLFGTAQIDALKAESLPSISINSLIEGNGNEGFVYTAENGTAKKWPVIIHHIENGRVYLSKIPQQITEVITDGSAFLGDGSKVQLLSPKQ